MLRWCETADDDDTDDDDDSDDDDSDTTEYALTTGNSTFPSENNNNDNDAMNSTNSNNMFLPVFSIINVLLFRLSVVPVSSSLCLFHMFVDDRCFDDYWLLLLGENNVLWWVLGIEIFWYPCSSDLSSHKIQLVVDIPYTLKL